MREHAKYFNKSFFKMAEPFVGKKQDVLNKMAIAAMC